MTLIVGSTRYKIDFTFALTVTLMLIFCHKETVLICLMSSLLHEAGHLILMYTLGQKVLAVTFGAFGIRIDRQSETRASYKNEAIIAFGGIGVNLIIALVSAIYYIVSGCSFAIRLTAVNIFIAIFNSIPIDTLDIGRVLRYTLLCHYDERRCHIIMKTVSVIAVNILSLICIIYSLKFTVNPSLIAVTVYLYVITLFKKWS